MITPSQTKTAGLHVEARGDELGEPVIFLEVGRHKRHAAGVDAALLKHPALDLLGGWEVDLELPDGRVAGEAIRTGVEAGAEEDELIDFGK